jgi:N-acetylneuraminate synthase/N,N'-diacetyllegionaminate synthase
MMIQFGSRKIGDKCPVLIVAEIGVNHNGDIEKAKLMIDQARWAGADAVKFQVYQVDGFVDKNTPLLDYQKGCGFDNQYDMLSAYELFYDDFRELKAHADKKNIMFLATPHSCRADVDLVVELCSAIKVGSGSLRNYELLSYIGKKGLPVILSTGMSTLDEIKEAVTALLPKDLAILYCVSEYPCLPSHAFINMIPFLRKQFGCVVGFSDHTMSTIIPAAAVALGAKIVEKHFTFDKSAQGPDHFMSLNKDEFFDMVHNIREVEKSLMGGYRRVPTAEELKIRDVTCQRGLSIGKGR